MFTIFGSISTAMQKKINVFNEYGIKKVYNATVFSPQFIFFSLRFLIAFPKTLTASARPSRDWPVCSHKIGVVYGPPKARCDFLSFKTTVLTAKYK